MNKKIKAMALAGVLALSAGLVQAADQQQVYGSQLMTQQERAEYQNRMRNAKSDQERQQFRNEHHQRMQQRAKEQGVTLPDAPPGKGGGMGPGDGMGQGAGKGQGGGMGSGGGMGQGR